MANMTANDEAQLQQTIEMFEVIAQSQPHDYQSLEILKEAYFKLGRQKDMVNTSKRIAQAYVQLGQLSSAILEYETILQHFPDDPDVQAALKQLEDKANHFSVQPTLNEPAILKAPATRLKKVIPSSAPVDIDDGRQAMYKIFVDSKIISAGDFDLCWSTPDLTLRPAGVNEPFIQVLADKGILPIEKSLRLLADRSRLAYLPLDKYDIDLEMARRFPAAICQRWAVLPFDRMNKYLLVATANPFNRQAAKEVEEASGGRLIWYLVSPIDLVKNLRKIFR